MHRASIGLMIAITLAASGSLSMEFQTRTFDGILHSAKVVFVGKPAKPFMTREWESGEQSGKKFRMRLQFYHYIVEEQIAAAGRLEPAVKPPREPPVQRPADEAALGKQMAEMKAAADVFIGEAKAALAAGKIPPAELFVRTEGRIHGVMWPAFGPANAWLFNERAAKIGALAEALGMAGMDPPAFTVYTRVILSALAEGDDLQPFVNRETGLDVREVTRAADGGESRASSGSLRGPGLQADPLLGRIRAQLKAALGAGAVAEIDGDRKRVRVRHSGLFIELIFQGYNRFVLAEIASRS